MMFDPNQPDTAAAIAATAPVNPVTYTDLDASSGIWGSRDLALKFPFRFKGVNYDKLTFREPNGFDVDLASKAEGVGMIRTLLVNLSTQPIEIFDVMHGQDRAAAMKMMGEFLSGSPAA